MNSDRNWENCALRGLAWLEAVRDGTKTAQNAVTAYSAEIESMQSKDEDNEL